MKYYARLEDAGDGCGDFILPIPDEVLVAIGVQVGDALDCFVEGDTLVLKKQAGIWGYRVMEFDDGGERYLEIREVHYHPDGRPRAYTERGVVVGSESPDGLEWVLERMREALGKPVLRPADFESLE